MAVARSSLTDPLAASALWRCGLVLPSLRSGLLDLRTDQRSSWVKGREVGQQLWSVTAVSKGEPGELPRGIAAVGAREQSHHDREHTHHDRGDPGDPDGGKAGQPDFGRFPHDHEHCPVYRILESGEFPTRGLCEAGKCLPRLMPRSVGPGSRPRLEGEAAPHGPDRAGESRSTAGRIARAVRAGGAGTGSEAETSRPRSVAAWNSQPVAETLSVPSRFNGPQESGNGGYCLGSGREFRRGPGGGHTEESCPPGHLARSQAGERNRPGARWRDPDRRGRAGGRTSIWRCPSP